MSTVTKVFVIINMVLAIAFAFIQLTLYSKRVKFKDNYEREYEAHAQTKKDLGGQIDELKKTQGKLTKDLADATRTVKERDSMIDTLRANYREYNTKYLEAHAQFMLVQSKFEESVNELNRRHDQIDVMHKIILKQQQALTVAKRNERNAIDQKIEIENDLNNVRQQLHEVDKEKNRVERDLFHHNWIIEKLMEAGVDVNDLVFGGGATPAPPIDGRVLAVRKDVNLVMLSVGSDDGVKPGFKFTIFRNDVYIGIVNVEKVFHDMSSARIIPDLTPKEISEGDSAATRVYGGITQ